MFISEASNGLVYKEDLAHPPVMRFAATAVGQTSADSPKSITIQNSGNAAMNVPIPQTGTNPAIPSGFAVNDNVPSACPLVNSGSPSSGTLAAGPACNLTVSFSPALATDTSGWLSYTYDAPGETTPSYLTTAVPLIVAGARLTPAISWPTPAAIIYGTPLNGLQLNSGATVVGTFVYSPAAGTILTAGSHSLSATFIPLDTTDFTTATANVTLTVNQATPTITWATPASIPYGKALSATQLNAKSSVPGSFTYSPAAGTVLSPGLQSINATFTPIDTTDYKPASASVTLQVNPAAPTLVVSPVSIRWTTASTTLGAYVEFTGAIAPTGAVTLQVDSGPALTATCKGTWPLFCTALYSTASLLPGSHTIIASVASDANFSAASKTGTLTVSKATPILAVSPVSTRFATASTNLAAYVEFATPAAPTGTVTIQVDSGAVLTAACKGTSPLFCTASYPTGTLSGGSHTITASVAADANYNTASKTGTLTVTTATPILVVSPVSTPYGTASTNLAAYVEFTGVTAPTGAVTLQVDSGSSLAATCKGTSPLFCTVSYPTGTLALGAHTITATVADDTNYNAASKTGTLTVNKGTPKIMVTPMLIAHGIQLTTLRAAYSFTGAIAPTGAVTLQVDAGPVLTATCNPSNICTVSYPTGPLPIGAHTITATIAADANYNAATGTATLRVQ